MCICVQVSTGPEASDALELEFQVPASHGHGC